MEALRYKQKIIGSFENSHLSQLIPQEMLEQVMTGTTIMAMEFDGGVIIGADSRTSLGTYCSNRYADKLSPITDKIYCCRSGASADTQAIADIVSSHMEILEIKLGEPPSVKIAANTFKEICYNYRDQLTAGIIVAGWDKIKHGQVYIIPLGGMMVRQPIAIGGSGSTFIWGFVDSNFREGMSKDEAVEFVKKAVTLALSRDNGSSGVVRIGIITEEGVERKVFVHNELEQFYQA